MNYNNFCKDLNSGHTEEDIKNSYAKHFGIKYDTSDRHDLYTPQVLFEFKYNKNFENLRSRATVLAQTLYYIHRLKYRFTDKQIPPILCLADKSAVIIMETLFWKDFTTDEEEKYDWDLAPSIPDENLIEDLSKTKELRNIHIYKILSKNEYEFFFEKLTGYLSEQLSLPLTDKKLITEENFEDVYKYWNENFGEDVRNGLKSSRYFISDIQKGRTHIDKRENKIIFVFESGERKIKKILLHRYEYFWSMYEKVGSQDLIRSVYAKLDRLTDEELRRFQGEFFTPLKFAKKGLDYLEKTLGKKWWNKNYRLWDMAVGTGNLQYHLSSEAYKYTYLSTYHHEDVIHCKKLFPEATVFHYDYLNDDVENVFSNGCLPFDKTWKLPKKLQEDLANPKLKWVININPPFATSQPGKLQKGKYKADVSDTKIRKVMHRDDLGEVSRELFAQFLFRIKEEFRGKIAYLGLFSKLKYLNATNDQKFRDKVFHFSFESGFMFSSVNFDGTSKVSQFPIGFLVWDLNKPKRIEEQKIVLDVFDTDVEKIARKHILVEHRDNFLSKWIIRLPATIKFPPIGSSIYVKSANKDARDRISEGFIGSLMCQGNDLQCQNQTAIFSGPYVSAGAFSITQELFEKSMVIHTVRRLPNADWINDRDQFMQPNKNLSRKFINDCIVWSLFSKSNETVAMKDVIYEKKTFQIPNNFFPFRIQDLKKWRITDNEIKKSLSSSENRFVAEWLKEQKFSKEANEVLKAGKELYKFYFEHFIELNTGKYKIHTWDAGWWQIRQALLEQNLGKELLENIRAEHNKLKENILSKLYEYGFLSL